MRKKYFLSFIVLLFGLHFSSVSAQTNNDNDDYGSTPNGAATTVVIQDVLANDKVGGLPVTLSDVYFSQVSTSGNYLTLDTGTGSVLFTNGPAPVGTYYLDYRFDRIGTPPYSNQGGEAHVSVNIGCEALATPVVASITPPSCTNGATVTLTNLPANGTWFLLDHGLYVLTGTGTSVTFYDVAPGNHRYSVNNYQDCFSPPLNVTVGYISSSLVGTYVDANTDGVPNVGDTINYQLTLTNISTCQVTNVNPGAFFPGGTIAVLAPGASHIFNRTYALTQTDIDRGVIGQNMYGSAVTSSESIYFIYSATTFYEAPRDGIKLVAYVDANGNGIKDINEQVFHNGNFVYTINNNGVQHYLASGDSPVIYESNPANTYDLNFSVYSAYSGYYIVNGSPYNDVNVPAGSGETTYYFALTALTMAPYVDTAINMHGTNPRPGFTYTNTMVYSNNGSEIIPSGTVTFTKDPAVSITSVSAAGAVITPTGFTYNFTNLLPGEWNHITVTLQVPTIPTVSLGQTLTNTVAVSIPTGDAVVNNNTSELSQTIIGSYDPNDKAESHGSEILYSGFTADDYLTYTIRFENTGTANAEFVRVVDVLDDKLDETSVRMVDASDRYTLNRVGNTLEWFFDDIQLPPSVQETTIGHGYVVFQVKPKPGYALGDIISNTADIYFDFNPAITTNTFSSAFVVLKTDHFAFNHFVCYPNPVKNTLTISNDYNIDSVVVTSVLGQQVLLKNTNDLKAEINLSQLTNGVYFVKVNCGQQSKTIKIVKQ